jgi:hypothetical protein
LAGGCVQRDNVAVAPAVVYITPLTITGLTCMEVAGLGPKFRADHRHATLSVRTLVASI